MPYNNFKFEILNLKFKNSGFTLVELLVSIGLIAVVTAISIPNLRNLNKDQESNYAASQLVNTLKTAQSSASSRITCPGGQTSLSWQVNLNISGSSDSYNMVCNHSSGSSTVLSSSFSSSPSSQVALDATSTVCGGVNVNIIFSNLQTTYQCNGTGSILTGEIRATLNKTGYVSKTIVIEQGGVIRVE